MSEVGRQGAVRKTQDRQDRGLAAFADAPNGPAFLAYPNFTKVYLKWNESLVYSTTAGYFATRLAGAPPVDQGRGPVEILSREETIQLQKLLNQQGYDVGKLDGVIGAKSRAAIKDTQIKFGMPPDSWPTRELLSRMQGG